MRLDLLLCRLRFSKSRSRAQHWIGEGHIKGNGGRVTAIDHPVSAGDILTLPIGREVRAVLIESLPDRRGPATEAQSHYRVLDGSGAIAIAGREANKGTPPP